MYNSQRFRDLVLQFEQVLSRELTNKEQELLVWITKEEQRIALPRVH
ncbi:MULTISPECIES: hypothetical protein [Priestia]|jgi:hypothetical protein|nr:MULTISPECIES: hypothetical protein [Priestia]MBE2978504.1 hypothetical protein [Priestia megaterium]